MTTSGDAQLFDEHFTIVDINHEKYVRCGRLMIQSTDSSIAGLLDVNTELYPCAVGETIRIVLATSLALDGSKDDGKGYRDAGRLGLGGEATLADMFDYVCHGKIYKFEESETSDVIKAYISFGGLLMALEGPYKKLTPLRVDDVYLLAKK
ncbi:DNA-directed RNA polymerases I, II, and III subunit RPABC3 [Clarireedia jacksonii]